MTFRLCGERLKELFLSYKLLVASYELQITSYKLKSIYVFYVSLQQTQCIVMRLDVER